ncbi:hypothetical protein [Membranihabitans maritimus]|uniref:hypothetical protein n=1 Tax=Membranihabitans maritimus TaxID=2904244 RepID=UPI001F3CB22E|nr:hypothetical protein [Membranihabitans maritimus]
MIKYYLSCFIYLFLACMTVLACERNKIIDGEEECGKNCDTLPDELIRWESPFLGDQTLKGLFAGPPVVVGENVVFISRTDFEEDLDSVMINFIAYDRLSGERKWTTSVLESRLGILFTDVIPVVDQLIVLSEKLFLNINSEDGSINAQRSAEDFPDGPYFKTIVGDRIYFTSPPVDQNDKYVKVMACDLYFDKWEIITDIEEELPPHNNYEYFRGKSYFKNQDGDLIGIFMDENY